MSFFAGCDFFMVLFILLIPAVLLGLSEKKLKWYRWLLSLFFIWEVYGSTKIQLLYLIGYVIFAAYLVKIYLYLRKKYGRNKYIYGHAVFLSLLPLLVYKIGGLRGYSVFGFLGISYICFKIIQVVIECYDGVIKEIDEFQFIEFLIFFPCLSSGPIDRSRRFAEDDNKIWSRQEYIELLWTGLYKIILGIFYKVACSGFFYYLLQTYFAGRHRPIYLVGYAYIYGLYLFFDFAGYSAMAVGTSYLLGIKTPDNFNKPFLSVDIKDFWNRWHITLSSWFRDFIFTRFMVDSARKKRFSAPMPFTAARSAGCHGGLRDFEIDADLGAPNMLWRYSLEKYPFAPCFQGFWAAQTYEKGGFFNGQQRKKPTLRVAVRRSVAGGRCIL